MNVNTTDVTGLLAGSPMAAPKPRSALGKDEFLQLLVTQLRHQDPMNPSNAQEFAAQLAQFTSLEQLTNLGERIEEQNALATAALEAQHATSALGVIGREVLAQSDQLVVGESGATVDFASAGAGEATLRVYDESGAEIRTVPLGHVDAGRTTRDLGDTLDLPPGSYTHAIEVAGADGEPVAASSFVRAQITGVQYTSAGPMLVSGELMIPLNQVVQVTAN